MSLLQSTVEVTRADKGMLFGQSLLAKDMVTNDQLAEALNQQRRGGGRLGEVLLRLKFLKENQVSQELAAHLSLEYICLSDIEQIDKNVAGILPENIARRFCLLPVSQTDHGIVVAMADPLNVVAKDTVMLKTNRSIKVVVSSASEINHAIEAVYHGCDSDRQKLHDIVKFELDDCEILRDKTRQSEQEDISCEVAATKAPVIRFVNLLLTQAVKTRASDIHIEPQENSMSIRIRIDGVLNETVPPSAKMRSAVVTRIKILAEMDIAERRLPQDGRFKIKAAGRDIDVRVSVIPTIYGEKAVLRILDPQAVDHNLDKLGFEPQLLEEFKAVLSQPHGIIVVTGPTGSGKSTTLYSALNYLRNPAKNITTVEDPVEYRLAGINQIQVKPEINLDFAVSLRAILRQDPDIILLGEIRDSETVEIAIKASLTGHLVLSTFHTNDAPSAISRFIYMGIEPYLLASTLNLIIAQRLVRRICENCKEPVTLNNQLRKRLNMSPELGGNSTFYRGRGCKACNGTGYLGRSPIFEFLVIDSDIREEIIASAPESKTRILARQKGYGGLFESGLNALKNGVTTAEEVLSICFNENIRN